jgi:hypothetical protein
LSWQGRIGDFIQKREVLDLERDFQVKVGYASYPVEAETVASVFDQIKQDNINLVLFFSSSSFEQRKIARAMAREAKDPAFGSAVFAGCTSGVVITPAGFRENSLVAMSFRSPKLVVGLGLGKNIKENPIHAARMAVTEAAAQLGLKPEELNEDYIGLVLIDGTCEVEEYVMLGLTETARKLRVFGGSAGDNYCFNNVFLHLNFQTFNNALILILVKTAIHFESICTSNYLPTEKKLRVTEVDSEKRIVTEFNGRPAVEEYCRAIGIKKEELQLESFVAHPLGLEVGENFYLRSPREIRENGGLKFFSRINNNTRLTVMAPGDLIKETRNAVETVRNKFFHIEAMIVFNCLLRYIESEVEKKTADISKLLQDLPVCGFNTYGEQYNGLHINQTLTMFILGKK